MTDSNSGGTRTSPRSVERKATWMTVVGAVFAAILLIFFLGLGAMAAVTGRVQFDCATFSFLAVGFAIGAAAAAGFLGGGAAAEGKLGVRGTQNPMQFSLYGGVAVLAIMLVLFFILRPTDCGDDRTETVTFGLIPGDLSPIVAMDFWTRVKPTLDRSDLEILVNEGESDGMIYLVNEEEFEVCGLQLLLRRDEPKNPTRYAQVEFGEYHEASLEYFSSLSDRELSQTSECFKFGEQVITSPLIIDTVSWTGYIQRNDVIPQSGTSDAFTETDEAPLRQLEGEEQSSLGWPQLISAAHAADFDPESMDYDALREVLSHGNDAEKVLGRQAVSDRFDLFRDMILKDLADPANFENANLLAGLLSALIAGIEQEQPELAPEAGRSLDVTIDALSDFGLQEQLFSYLGHPDESVRQQARRLVQRYPVTAFMPGFERVLSEEVCKDQSIQWQTYAAVFYFYNRLIQEGLNEVLNDEALSRWRGLSERIKNRFSECITSIERVDGALLDYGIATVATWSQKPAFAEESASDFLSYVGPERGSYYYQSHVERMEAVSSD